MKKTLLVIAILAVMAGFLCQDARADWATCTVNSFGIWGEYVVINLTDSAGAFTSVWFVPYQDQTKGVDRSKEMLATAMYAQANSKKVSVWTTGSSAWSLIYYMGVTN